MEFRHRHLREDDNVDPRTKAMRIDGASLRVSGFKAQPECENISGMYKNLIPCLNLSSALGYHHGWQSSI